MLLINVFLIKKAHDVVLQSSEHDEITVPHKVGEIKLFRIAKVIPCDKLLTHLKQIFPPY